MKYTKLRKIGKIGRINLEANKRLNALYEDSEIRNCELKLAGCENYPLNFCHRHERNWYKGDVELLSSMKQTVIGCQCCHDKIDRDKKLREEKFLILRGAE